MLSEKGEHGKGEARGKEKGRPQVVPPPPRMGAPPRSAGGEPSFVTVTEGSPTSGSAAVPAAAAETEQVPAAASEPVDPSTGLEDGKIDKFRMTQEEFEQRDATRTRLTTSERLLHRGKGLMRPSCAIGWPGWKFDVLDEVRNRAKWEGGRFQDWAIEHVKDSCQISVTFGDPTRDSKQLFPFELGVDPSKYASPSAVPLQMCGSAAAH